MLRLRSPNSNNQLTATRKVLDSSRHVLKASSSPLRRETQVSGQASFSFVMVSLLDAPTTKSNSQHIVPTGPYAPAVLRFQISFPDAYPRLPPLVTFSTDMFHPLITPLTTYMYTTDIQDNGTVSATDEERLPPGGFSLRHGFPDWFGRRRNVSSRQTSAQQQAVQTPPRQPKANPGSDVKSSATPSTQGSSPGFAETQKKDVSTFDVLRYIRSTFDDEDVLDSLPVEAAGNPGAWHAWRTHRQLDGKASTQTSEAGAATATAAVGSSGSNPGVRRPGEWNWEGVWEERVKKSVAASLSEPVLYGGVGAADDVVSCPCILLPLTIVASDQVRANILTPS